MNPIFIRSVLSAAALSGVLVLGGLMLEAQSLPSSVLPVSVGVGSSRAAIAEVDATIARMVSSGELVRTYAAADARREDRRHEYFVQVHRGIRVAGGGVSRQRSGDTTRSAFGTLYLNITVDTAPGLSTNAAMNGLRETVGTRLAPGGDVTLLVLPQFDGSYRLTYRATFQDGQVRYVDAVNGDLVRSEDAFTQQQAVGTGAGAHGDVKKVSASRSGLSSYEAVDLLRPATISTRSTQGSNTPFEQLFEGAGSTAVDDDNTWANAAVIDAHVHAGLAYDYFHQQMGWQGLDGANARIDQVVTDGATLPDNALFAPPASSASSIGLMAFGVSSAGYPMATLDIVGHEAMHGVTFFSLRRRTGSALVSTIISDGLGPSEANSAGQRIACNTALLAFSDGSTAPLLCSGGQYVLASNHGGAINEGFSDVFGTAIEFQFQPRGDAALRSDYLMAEDTVPGGPASTQIRGLIRSLENPTALTVDPAGMVPYPDHFDRRVRYISYVRNGQAFLAPFTILNGAFVNVSTNNGAVHHNATVLGHVFYRAIEGGTHRTSGRSVAGVGFGNRHQIERIFFRAMSDLMPATATFQTAAGVLRQAAADLHGVQSAAYRAIDEALLAAGL